LEERMDVGSPAANALGKIHIVCTSVVTSLVPYRVVKVLWKQI
jgi:hypothetical protein